AERVEAEILAPEALLEPGPELGRLPAQLARPRRLAQRVVDLRHPHPRVEDVALQLAERLRGADLAAVGVHHGVAGVLPPEVLVPDLAPRLVLLEPVAVGVAVAVDP